MHEFAPVNKNRFVDNACTIITVNDIIDMGYNNEFVQHNNYSYTNTNYNIYVFTIN